MKHNIIMAHSNDHWPFSFVCISLNKTQRIEYAEVSIFTPLRWIMSFTYSLAVTKNNKVKHSVNFLVNNYKK